MGDGATGCSRPTEFAADHGCGQLALTEPGTQPGRLAACVGVYEADGVHARACPGSHLCSAAATDGVAAAVCTHKYAAQMSVSSRATTGRQRR